MSGGADRAVATDDRHADRGSGSEEGDGGLEVRIHGSEGSSSEDDKLAAEKIHECGGGDQGELGDDGGDAESFDEKRTREDAGEVAEGGDESEDGKFLPARVPSRGEHEPGIEEVDNEVCQGEGDDIVNNEISLAQGIADGFAIDEGRVQSGKEGQGEGQDGPNEDRRADRSGGTVLGNLHKNRRVAREEPAGEGLAIGKFHAGEWLRLKRGGMVA